MLEASFIPGLRSGYVCTIEGIFTKQTSIIPFFFVYRVAWRSDAMTNDEGNFNSFPHYHYTTCFNQRSENHKKKKPQTNFKSD